MLTAGRTAATEAALTRYVDGAGARTITVTDGTGTAELDSTAIGRLQGISGVSWVVGFGLASDMRIGSMPDGGTPVSSRPVFGSTVPAIPLLSGRWPSAGEAVVSPSGARGLGLTAAAGSITDGTTTYPVVGAIAWDQSLADVSSPILVGTDPTVAQPMPLAYVEVDRAEDVPRVAAAIRQVAGAERPENLNITTSDLLLQLGRVVGGDFGALSRELALLSVGAGMVLIALALYVSIASRRRDFGRRRALGATRSALVALVLIQAGVPAAAGSLVGSIAGATIVKATGSGWPPAPITLATAVLVTVSALAAALPAALIASFRDPLSVLRVS